MSDTEAISIRPDPAMEYRLIDFGGGRKLESFGGYIFDRPSPAAESASRCSPQRWRNADASFDTKRGWKYRRRIDPSPVIDCGGFVMPIRPRPHGHVGLFPEQQSNWDWLADVPRATELGRDRAAALNLFAYTGAASLALARVGFDVTHVDAAKPNIAAAADALRINVERVACLREAAAENAQFVDPRDWVIRWIVDDAAVFVNRCVRRGRRFHTIVMDPPAYGHDPRGRAWRIERDLWPLVDGVLSLLEPSGRLLITGHTAGITPSDIQRHVQDSVAKSRPDLNSNSWRFVGGRLGLKSFANPTAPQPPRKSRTLDAGFFVRAWW